MTGQLCHVIIVCNVCNAMMTWNNIILCHIIQFEGTVTDACSHLAGPEARSLQSKALYLHRAEVWVEAKRTLCSHESVWTESFSTACCEHTHFYLHHTLSDPSSSHSSHVQHVFLQRHMVHSQWVVRKQYCVTHNTYKFALLSWKAIRHQLHGLWYGFLSFR